MPVPASFSSSADYSLANETIATSGNFLSATMSFADAMKMVTTITLPEFEQASATADPAPRNVVPAWRADKPAKSSTTYVPDLD